MLFPFCALLFFRFPELLKHMFCEESSLGRHETHTWKPKLLPPLFVSWLAGWLNSRHYTIFILIKAYKKRMPCASLC